MGTIQITNTSSQAKLFIDTDKGDRFNQYAKWVFTPSEVKGINEEEIDITADYQLPNALRSGQATLTETDVDSLTDLNKKNFLMSGLDTVYKVTSAAVVNKRLVKLDTTTNKVAYVGTLGDKPFGATKKDGTTGETIRVKNGGTVTVNAGGTITSGSKLVSDTTGRAVVSVVAGLWQFGKATSDATTGQDLTIALDIKQIS